MTEASDPSLSSSSTTDSATADSSTIGAVAKSVAICDDGLRWQANHTTVMRLLAGYRGELEAVDLDALASQILGGLHDEMDRRAFDRVAIHAAASRAYEAPEHAQLAARMLADLIDREVASLGIDSFSEGIAFGARAERICPEVATFVDTHKEALDAAIDESRTDRLTFFGLQTLYDRYFLKDPETRLVFETPQAFFMRVAVGLSRELDEAIETYRLLSSLAYMPSSPTLFNTATVKPQLCSCFLLDSPADDLEAIYDRYKDIAMLSKWAGGIGLAFHRVRSEGSLIAGTNGLSNGIVPFLKTLDASVAAVNQGGRRKGAACVYLEPWHADVHAFLELRDNTGNDMRRTHNLHLANWVPDLFMERVRQGEMWSLFDPADVPELVDTWGEAFEQRYRQAERDGLATKQVPAQKLYRLMMRTLAQTGNGWMTFKDAANRSSNQTASRENVIHSSNLCTEILEVTSDGETAVCNLGSINLARHLLDDGSGIDWDALAKTVRQAVPLLDRVIDTNDYPTDDARRSNQKWRPVGLGVMGLQDALFTLRLPFDSPQALALSTHVQEEIYYNALRASCDLAAEYGAHPAFAKTRAASGVLHIDHFDDVELHDPDASGRSRWDRLRDDIATHGLRNSLLVAIAPTASIASICGCYECVEPQVSNLFKRETLSGEFLQVNRYLINDLRERGLWNSEMRDALKQGEGSVQHIEAVPAELRRLYRTAWELSQRTLIDLAAARTPFIDQSQSLNLFVESPELGALSSMYMYAWQRGLKTTYYLRSRPATRIRKATVSDGQAGQCDLENPEVCEACQ